MKAINLTRLIETKNLDVQEVARELFPEAKYPKLALDRILKNESYLNSNQISRLSLMTGIPINFLYEGGEWGEANTSSNGVIVFSAADYRAELDTNSWTTKLFHKNSIFHEAVISNPSIPLSEYLSELTSLIIKNSKP